MEPGSVVRIILKTTSISSNGVEFGDCLPVIMNNTGNNIAGKFTALAALEKADKYFNEAAGHQKSANYKEAYAIYNLAAFEYRTFLKADCGVLHPEEAIFVERKAGICCVREKEARMLSTRETEEQARHAQSNRVLKICGVGTFIGLVVAIALHSKSCRKKGGLKNACKERLTESQDTKLKSMFKDPSSNKNTKN